jgi:transcriptional regulator with XRE-family HTH domain
MKDPKKNISTIIKSIRETKGYSQSYMAKKLNITQQAYSSIEKSPENMSLKKLYDIAELMQVEIITLLGIENEYVQNNFNQQGGYAVTKLINYYSVEEKDSLDERLILELQKEVNFLKTCIQNKK